MNGRRFTLGSLAAVAALYLTGCPWGTEDAPDPAPAPEDPEPADPEPADPAPVASGSGGGPDTPPPVEAPTRSMHISTYQTIDYFASTTANFDYQTHPIGDTAIVGSLLQTDHVNTGSLHHAIDHIDATGNGLPDLFIYRRDGNNHQAGHVLYSVSRNSPVRAGLVAAIDSSTVGNPSQGVIQYQTWGDK